MAAEAPVCPRCAGRGRFVDEPTCCVCQGAGSLPADYAPRALKVGQREFLQRIRASGADDFTERDWSLALPLRDAGLIEMEHLPGWSLVPVVRHFQKRMVVSWLGELAIRAAEDPAHGR